MSATESVVASAAANHACDLCAGDGGELLHRNSDWRLVLIDDAHYPGFCRVIWNSHAKEMSDLTAAQRSRIMHTTMKVEQVVRQVMQPEKINLASLGNMTPHVHWHVIPRYLDDAHFPQPVWGAQQRETDPATLAARRARLPELKTALRAAMAALETLEPQK